MSAATKSGVEEVIKEAGRMLTEIPFADLEIADEERYILKKRNTHMKLMLNMVKSTIHIMFQVHL